MLSFLPFGVGSEHLKRKIINFIFFRGNSDFPCLQFHHGKALLEIIFGRNIFIFQPISKSFVARFATFGMQKDGKILFYQM